MQYLTKQEKEKTLGYLRSEYKNASLNPDGHVDLELIPYLERINTCNGVATLQSCTGHKPNKERNYTFDGHLWVRLDKEKAILFERKIIDLVKSELINQVSKMYSFYKGKNLEEVINIIFKGHEKDSFYLSIEFITKFFERLDKIRCWK